MAGTARLRNGTVDPTMNPSLHLRCDPLAPDGAKAANPLLRVTRAQAGRSVPNRNRLALLEEQPANYHIDFAAFLD